MGVHGLWQLLQPAGKPIALESLEGKILAVDVSIWLNKAAKGMRDKFGNPVYNAHLIVIFQRLCKLLFYKVKPIFVFDGGVPELKKKTIAARRERKLTAEVQVQTARKKILHNYLKRKALETVTGQKGSKGLGSASWKGSQDLFELPPLAVSYQADSPSEDEDDIDVEAEWMAGMKSERVEQMFEELGSVDIDAEDFKNLPSEIQHEILMEMKESYRRRYNQRKSQEMPEEAGNFSDFQLRNLFRRGKITKKIDEIRKDMKTKSSGHITELEEEDALRKKLKSFEANRVASEDKQHYILLKKGNRKAGNILFNSELEVNNPEIYEGVKRNENFERLEREPLQFNSSSVDQPYMVAFMSDSTEDSDFDEEYSLSDARRFTIDQSGNAKVLDENVTSQGTEVIATTSALRGKLELPGSRKNEFRKTDDRLLSSSESSSEIEELSVASNEELREKEFYNEDQFSNSGAKTAVLDVSTGERNSVNANMVGTTSAYLKDDNVITELLHDTATSKNFSFDENATGFSRVSKAVSVAEESEVNASGEDVQAEAKMASIWEKTSSVEALTGPLSEKRQFDSEKSSTSMEIISSNEEDISAVPKPDVRFEEAVPGGDNDDLKEFKSAVKDCTSAEELSSLRESLVNQQKELLKETDRHSRAAASVGSDEYNDVQELLRLFGIPFVTSPMEAEAQCAVLDLSNQTHGSITDDSDILLFGGRRVYKNIFNQNKYAELYTLENINHTLFLDREKMIALAYLTGSDYTEGIQGVGVITAMEVLQEFGGGSMQALVNLKIWYDGVKANHDINIFQEETKLKAKLRLLELPRAFPNHKVWETYINPTADYSEESFEWGKPDLDAIREFARHKFGWHSSRTDEILLPVMKQLNSNQGQTTLNRYFTEALDTTKRRVSSKRLQRTVNLMRSGVTEEAHLESHTSLSEKKQRMGITPQIPVKSNVDIESPQISNVIRQTSKTMSFKNRRLPSKKDFQVRVAKSKFASRGRRRRTVPPNRAEGNQVNRNKISSRKIDLSESSSDSDINT